MPPNFSGLSKVPDGVLDDDFVVKGYALKTRQKTAWSKAVLSTHFDLFPGGSCATPAKLTWKVPAPFGVAAVSVDKLEVDKAGKFKLDVSSTKLYPDLKVDCRTDFADLKKMMLGCTYTGYKRAHMRVETKVMKPQDFKAEVVFGCCRVATVGMKLSSGVLSGDFPDFGLRLIRGSWHGALIAQNGLRECVVSCCYKATPQVNCAASYTHGGKRNGSGELAVSCKDLYKVKVTSDQAVLCSARYTIAKGLSSVVGFKYNAKKGAWSYGLSLSIE